MNDEGSLALGSKKFQEKTRRSEHTEKIQKIIERFLDTETGLIKNSLSQERPCPLCASSPEQSRVVFIKEGFAYRKCSVCSLIYVSPALREAVLKEAYEESDYAQSWMQVLLNPVEQQFNRPKFELGLREIEQTVGKKGKLLDIGCAVGQFLSVGRDSGWDVCGIELNQREREYCCAQGFRVLGEPLTATLFPPASFDAVTLWEVLEHVPHPRQLTESIYTLLKPGGVALIVVPNVDSLAARILQEKCNMFFGLGHINMFTIATLTRLLQQAHFKIVSSTTIISEISVLNNYMHYEHPYLGNAQQLLNLFDILNEEYIHRNLLGYKLKIIARKA